MATGHKTSRRRLPEERAALIHKFSVGGHEGYLSIGLYPDNTPGEIFICMAKQGSTVSGLMDGIALLTSINLQYGVPLEVLIKKFKHSRFEPMGHSGNPNIGFATSILDYIFRYLELKFLDAPVDAPHPDMATGMPLAEEEPETQPWTEKDKAPDPVLLQAEKISSEITEAANPLIDLAEEREERDKPTA